MTADVIPQDLHNVLVKQCEVKNLYKGDCKGCGECCSRFLPMSEHDIERLRNYVQSNDIKMSKQGADIDLRCPYLTNDGECAVYPARPDICTAYRCDKHAVGDLDAIGMYLKYNPYKVVDLREVMSYG